MLFRNAHIENEKCLKDIHILDGKFCEIASINGSEIKRFLWAR